MSDNNGGNPRLDRIEKLIERSERANQEAHARHERAHARNERAHARNERSHARFEREMSQLKDHLRRWTILGVKEARNQRKKQQRMDDALTALIGTVDALVRRPR